MTIDISTLRAVPVRSKAADGWRGSRYYDEHDVLTAKTCSSCREIKFVAEFVRRSTAPDGITSECKACSVAYAAKRKAKHPEYSRESSDRCVKKRRLRTEQQIMEDRKRLRPDGLKTCRTCHLGQAFTYFYPNTNNADGLQNSCIECANERKRTRFRRHWTSKGIPFDQCIYCQMMTDLTTGDLHGDHVIARAIGGPDEMSNIAPACYACNICKGEDTLEKFLAEQFFYEEDRQEILDRLRQYGYVA